jgi:hypothetical protein
MIVILHLDDNGLWLENVAKHVKEIRINGQAQAVTVLSRFSVAEASNVVRGTDHQMRRLADQGHQLHGVILDLMVDGGTKRDLDNWLSTVQTLAGTPSAQDLDTIDAKCPALPLGRLAAQHGAKVVILTNVAQFLAEDLLPASRQQALVMAAAGASAYVVKSDDGGCYREIQKAMSC